MWLYMVTYGNYLEPQKLAVLKLTLAYWSQNLMGSWYFVLMTLGDTYWGDSLTHVILSTASYLFLTQRSPGYLRPINHSV